jgi:hypothetical protein
MFVVNSNSHSILVKILNTDKNFDPIQSCFEKIFSETVNESTRTECTPVKNDENQKNPETEKDRSVQGVEDERIPFISTPIDIDKQPVGSSEALKSTNNSEVIHGPIDDAKNLLLTNIIEIIHSILTFNNDCVQFLKTYSIKISKILKTLNNTGKQPKQLQKKIKAISEYIEPCLKLKSYTVEELNILIEKISYYENSIQSLPKPLLTILRIVNYLYQVYLTIFAQRIDCKCHFGILLTMFNGTIKKRHFQ